MKRYLHNTKVVFRTALRVVVMTPLMLLWVLGESCKDAADSLDHKLPGSEQWKAAA